MNNESFNLQARNFLQDRVWLTEQHPYLIKQILSQGGLQQTFTPIELCKDMLTKLSEYTPLDSVEILVLFNLEIVDTLIRVFGVEASRITFFADYEDEGDAARHWYNVNCPTDIIAYDMKRKEICMPKIKKKFDVVVMNPPYQAPKNGVGGGSTIWEHFVKLSINDLVTENGYLAAVHPANWRTQGEYTEVGTLLKSKQMLHLEINNVAHALKVFRVATRFDWYVSQNTPVHSKTVIVGEDQHRYHTNISNLSVIPNGMIDEVVNFFAKDENDKIALCYNRTTYGTDKPWMSKEQTKQNKFPCICHINVDNKISSLYYSSKNHGHFGVPKVVFARMQGGVFVDMKGEYGCCQDVSYIIDKPENLEQIANALKSEKFLAIAKMMSISIKDRYDRTAMKCLRKDFWKDFI